MVITAETIEHLEEYVSNAMAGEYKVNGEVHKGFKWYPVGGVLNSGSEFYQSVVNYEYKMGGGTNNKRRTLKKR